MAGNTGPATASRDEILEALKGVQDPELGVDVVNLGLIYRLEVKDEGIEVDMTMTSPGCPLHAYLSQAVKQAIEQAAPGRSVEVNVVWSPPWTPDRMSPEARARFGL